MNVLIIEDEALASKRLSRMLLEINPQINIVGICDSVVSSVAFLKGFPNLQLIFMDIQLGDGLSFEIAKQISITAPIIFTTAFDEYAIKAFELNSIDYLLKPISRERLQQSLNKLNQLQSQNSIDLNALLPMLMGNEREYKQRFLVAVADKLVSVNISDVAYFYSTEKSTFITLFNGKCYAIDYSLDKLETLIHPTHFFRVNRNYIVSHQAVKQIFILSKSRLKLEILPPTDAELLVSTSRTHDFRTWLDR